MSKVESPTSTYTPYTQVNKELLAIDIETIKENIGLPTKEDFQHLLKLERWGRIATFSGYGLIAVLSLVELFLGVSTLFFWSMAILSAVLISTGNVSRWSNVTHPILHGAYDKVPNIPKRYTKRHFAKGSRRYLDWLDWIKPEAWAYEHNIMHHYHLGEEDDPDCVQRNAGWLHSSNILKPLRYVLVFVLMGTWKFLYYAPNTLRILANKKRKEEDKLTISHMEWNPKKKNGFELWMDYILPYAMIKFIVIPALFIPFGITAVFNALIIVLIAEFFTNVHSFVVIVPNHSAGDIYMFDQAHEGQGEFYLRQIMGSVNYNTGGDVRDFFHGWLNYQIEHHLFPNLPLSQYQKMQPKVKEICEKHNIEYRQESVFRRLKKTIDLLVGNTKMLSVHGV
ncbi:MAG: POSSIBLE LINOLEOYL-CoA DESATURASE (DELTA(6)-DESATURASE) [uncultured Sulfurovum sp.]|uniref:POSSIBLE LINOLEOYL-CoA DESATURASE (DELTA(6)-DESATURASE) n=1 Tax=uncultured Sulfurovum sp. TaxID=269237 RepID=A0A6S6TEY2_9BACT|nr:MAG: POSSIBLE LINOLEOYL-CoA DESATURASE (DELTA(6)-DESATURASE) [uncultured Sulfurovum sp.]